MEQNQNYTQNQYTYYQNLYNSFGAYKPEMDMRAKEIRKMGMLAGGAMIGFTAMQYVMVFILSVFGLYDSFINDAVFQMGFSCIAPLLYVVIPFSIMYLTYNTSDKNRVAVFDKPKSKELFLFAIFAGLMICSVSDRITAVFQAFSEGAGLEFSQSEMLTPDNLTSKILSFVACAVVPPLTEELAFRGILMQPLRKYGDKFAIVMSSILFALAHGNMVQIPFAFFAGLALGYFQVATGSIWTSIAIHFLNNGIATIISMYYEKYPHASDLFFYVVEFAIFIIGIIAIILFMKNKDYKLKNDNNEFKGSVKYASYLCVPTIIVALITAIDTSLGLTKVTNATGILVLVGTNIALAVLTFVGTLKLKNDDRITYSGWYTFSAVLMCIAAVVSSFSLFVSILTGGLNG